MNYLRLSPFPDMPTDIARLIFETAAWEDGRAAYRLVLVSKVVREWIDPILYYSVTLSTSSELASFYESMVSRDYHAFFSRGVKVLCIGDRDSGTLQVDHPIDDILLWAKAVLDVCTGVRRLAVWVINHDFELHRFTRNSGRLRPTHISLDITDHSWNSRLNQWVEILPESLTHLNLDCFNNEDIEDIPWQKVFASCPNLAHISLSGSAVHDSCRQGALVSLIVSPVMSQLPSTVATFTMVVESVADSEETMLENQLDTISEASNRFVVVSHGISPHKQIQGLHTFEKRHTFDSEWGTWRGEDTWDLAQRCVTNRLKQYDECNTGTS